MKKIFEKVKENKEIIATAVGVTAVATGVVLGLKAKTKALEIKKEFTQTIKECEEVLEQYPKQYSAEDLENDKFIVSCNACGKLIRLYAPAAVLAVGGGICTVKNGVKVYKMYRK